MKNVNGKKMSALFAVIIVLLIVAMFLVNTVALILSNRYPLAVDLTANAVYEIGEETKTVLDSLTEDVTIDVERMEMLTPKQAEQPQPQQSDIYWPFP